MVIHIHTGDSSLCLKSNNKVQSVPFKIQADCDAPVSAYFEPYVKKTDNILTASFRGHPLKGKTIQIPESYKGVVFYESVKPTTDKEDRKFFIMKEYKEITYWNWDKIPSKNDAFVKALDWIDIAEALHSPITEE